MLILCPLSGASFNRQWTNVVLFLVFVIYLTAIFIELIAWYTIYDGVCFEANNKKHILIMLACTASFDKSDSLLVQSFLRALLYKDYL